MFGQSHILPKNREVNIERKLTKTPPREPELPPKTDIAVRHEGEKDALQKIVREKEISDNMLDEALGKAQTVLFRCKTVFPFDFFPNDLIIDLAKVTVVNRSFFMSGTMQSVYMRDIVDVEVDTGPFFSSLSVVDMFYAQNKLQVKYLRKKDAIKSREIILGVVAANKLNVNVTTLSGYDLVDRIRQLALTNRVPTP